MNSRFTTSLGSIVLCISALAGCSSSSSGSDGNGAGSGSASPAATGSCKSYTACTLLTNDEVGTAIGTTIASAKEDDSSTEAPLPASQSYECNYNAGHTPSIALAVTCSATPTSDATKTDLKQTIMNTGRTLTDVSGIGSDAFWSTPTADSGIAAANQFFFYSGTSTLVSITVSAGGSPSFDPETAAEQLARLVAGRL